MNQDQFNQLTEKLLAACKDALGMKAGEYAREGDRLHNFYAAARKRNQHPLDSLLGMQVKHRVSIDDICEDIVKHSKFPTDEMMLEKFKDDINYNLLAFALIHELREKARKEAFKKGPVNSRKITVDISVVGAKALGEQIKKFAENYKARMQPPATGTITRVEAMRSFYKAVMWEGDVYLPVQEESTRSCNGCFFEFKKFADGCSDFSCVEAGVIWKKIV